VLKNSEFIRQGNSAEVHYSGDIKLERHSAQRRGADLSCTSSVLVLPAKRRHRRLKRFRFSADGETESFSTE
jgi:hypothetical protein